MRLTVAVLLLSFISVVGAGFAFYPYIMGLITRMKTTFPSEILFQDTPPEINDTCIIIHVRNIGNTDITVTRVYVNNQPYLLEIVEIPAKTAKTLYLTGTYWRGVTYTVKLEYSGSRYITFKVSYD
ncbi:MAG: hypothetical protein U9O89_06015 [Thermoproteota archaeon]|nr:hypothetical protein [Thermoproteota archaeon]